MTEVGTILGQWIGADSAIMRSSGVHQINAETSAASGVVTKVERDYSSLKQNAETFILSSTGTFGSMTSQISDKAIFIKAEGMTCYDQTYQAYGVISNFVSTIGIYNNADNSTSIQLDMLSPEFSYDLTLSDDRQSLYVTVYYNSLTSAVIGTNNYCDYVTLTGIEPLKVTTDKANGYLNIELPYTTSSISDINTLISGAKYINYINVIGGADKTQIIIGINEGYEYHVTQNQNQYSLIFMIPGSGSAGGGSTGSGSVSNGGSNGGISQTLDKASCEIIMPKPEGLTSSMISDEDNYFNHNFVIRLQGDYTSVINNSTITNTSGTVTGINVSLNGNNETEITVHTSKLQGYQYGMDDTNFYINVGNPKDIYKNIVILDPGHGGGANGAEYFGTKEKNLNYKILYTIGKKYFNQDTTKLKAYYTRINDVDMSLSDRAAFASRYGADLFVSLHMNASLTRSVYGTEIYYSNSNNSPNAAGLTSKILADTFAERIPASLGTLKRGSRAERYTVVHKNTVPAVLIELGFLSNESDYNKLSDANFQENAARTIYETLLQVLNDYPTGR
jgi:N-acetylmuramoyl-L-alanine amidase